MVVKAPPGAGKTTVIPPALLQAGVAGEGQMLLIQPRRLAARAAASRLARLMKARLGEEVGYQVRFDNCTKPTTKLIAMTTGILLRRLQSDPLLENVSCVLLDEFHERSLELDLALGMLQRVRTTLRPELKLIVMSATLDPGPIVHFLGQAVAVTSEGRAFPVDIEHSASLSRDPIEQQVASVLPQMLNRTNGHVLVFLPGVGEIRRTERVIRSLNLCGDFQISQLYGDLPPQKQDFVLSESRQRKVILSTNVAETSVTIPGVTAVIDSGLARVLRFDSQVGLPKLQIESISQASADQRAGRAGRTEPGICFRLWPSAAHRSRPPEDAPEIQRSDFSDALLMMLSWGERDVSKFPWLTPPPDVSVVAARQLLQRLGAIDDADKLTDEGQAMLALPLHPRLSRFMVEAKRLSVVADGALVAALLTERDPFRGSVTVGQRCGISDRLGRFKAFCDGDQSAVSNPAAAKQVKRVADQIRGMVDRNAQADQTQPDQISRALLTAYPDRVARRREHDPDRAVMVGGSGVRCDRRSLSRDSDLFLCIDLDARGSEATVRLACEVDESWLDQRLVVELDEPFFHPSLQAVVARRRRYFDDLLLSESPIECRPGQEVAELLYQQAKVRQSTLMPAEAVGDFIARVRVLMDLMPELELPKLDEVAINEVLLQLCYQRTSIAELKSAPWLDHLKGRYDYQQLQSIDQHTPARITLPSGNSVAVEYLPGKAPIAKVRIQEIYGWRETPQIAGGRVRLQLHLLGPNFRAQQITDDLASFWSETYQHVRKELRGRYPKHHWPEDPTSAPATANGLKPRN